METEKEISASILSANLAELGKDLDLVLKAGASRIHFDVMDNQFVPNLTFGPDLCKSIRNYGITAPIDVHLMVGKVDHLIPMFSKAGATSITIHPEIDSDLIELLDLIKNNKCKAGIAINPATKIDVLTDEILNKIDLILFMSVNPGFAGQSFMPEVLSKIQDTKYKIKKLNKNISIQIDGGIKIDNISQAAKSGVDVFVAGSGLFNTKDYSETIKLMQHAIKRGI